MYGDLLCAFAEGQMDYAEFAGRLLRRSRGEPEDLEPPEDFEPPEGFYK